MAQSKNNVLTHGLSGKIGNLLVFRQLNGKTIVTQRPKKPTILAPSVVAHNTKFAQASRYAKSAIQNPALLPVYAAQAKIRGINAYNAALGDFMNSPEITQVITAGYSGNIDDKIIIHAVDDFSVNEVSVRIEKANGTLIEEGAATEYTKHWEYTAKTFNPAISGCRIMISASDLPLNQTVKEIIL